MPFPKNSYFNPSDKYKQAWSLVPQARTVSLSGHKTRSLYSGLASAIPIFYILMFLAIGIDVYLGFSILAKSGVNMALIAGSVLADLFLAILPFLLANLSPRWNHINVENKIFQKELECKTMKKKESRKEFEERRAEIMEGDLKKYASYKLAGKIVRYILIFAIFAIAAWKVYTFYKVIPPGMNIFDLANGKIVIIFSLLCAIFHVLGSEKAVAHLRFFFLKKSEFKQFQRTNNGQKTQPTQHKIKYKGEYNDASSGHTSIIKKENKATLEFTHIIRDDEIQALMNAQTDDSAKRGVAIKCKEEQIINL